MSSIRVADYSYTIESESILRGFYLAMERKAKVSIKPTLARRRMALSRSLGEEIQQNIIS